MADRSTTTFWIPLLLGAAFLVLTFALPALPIRVAPWALPASLVATVALLVLAAVLAYRDRSSANARTRGGRGGNALVKGFGSEAVAGDGGAAGTGHGGDGGRATVKGDRSRAQGGRGGAG